MPGSVTVGNSLAMLAGVIVVGCIVFAYTMWRGEAHTIFLAFLTIAAAQQRRKRELANLTLPVHNGSRNDSLDDDQITLPKYPGQSPSCPPEYNTNSCNPGISHDIPTAPPPAYISTSTH
ncbi:hypothetical protein BDQ17DRAFT_1036056 [Cyathus striatus]|nr:hypothetical protein BDQ17DRAFT_1036056 [Cyathus striatus]